MMKIALFGFSPDGSIRLIGEIQDEDLVKEAAQRISVNLRKELANLEGPVRLVPNPGRSRWDRR